ncbi:unnamed protein product [Clonostachys solani]|uniref:Zn(2)-C6 fungal-type domain-containing protein n=1 Tax=Clonostachys solani TaxID=160281 RepID=A0A9N9W583_9HYPO|nr:unnamed protein product [Clonostachys solani]
MPGIPRTKGCSVCKIRKIKCDENWPSCTPCRRSKRQCPGPTPLVNDSYIAPRDAAPGSASHGSKRGLVIRDGHRATAKAKAQANKLSLPSNHPSEGGPLTTSRCQQSRCLGALRSHPMTRPDQLASYLNAVLHDGTYQGDLAQLDVLSFIPQRLHLSQCLSDSVAFWCHLQLDTRRKLPKPSVATLHYYSKALQSLQSTLEGKNAYRTETLAAAVLLQRTTLPFHKTVKSDSIAHAKGISALVMQRGPPNLDDDLDVSLAIELCSNLFCWHSHGDDDDTHHSEVEPESPDVDGPEPTAESLAIPGQDVIREVFVDLLNTIPALNSIHENPESKKTVSLEAADVRRRLYDLNAIASKTASQIKNQLKEMGLIQVLPDPESFVKKRYHFESVDIAQAVLGIFILEIIAPRMLLGLTSLCDPPEVDDVLQRYRDASVELWMCIPYLDKLGLTDAQIISCAFCLSYEAADATERDLVADVAARYDTYLSRLKNNRTLLIERVLRTAKQLTGGADIMPIQVLMIGGPDKKSSPPKNKQPRASPGKPQSAHLLHGCLFFQGLLSQDPDDP